MIRYLLMACVCSAVIVLSSCALNPWHHSSPYTKEELQKLSDKDIYVIDGERYIKVPAEATESGFRYVKVDDYLRGEVVPLPLEAQRPRRPEPPPSREMPSSARPAEKMNMAAHSTPVAAPHLKRKIAILPFEDRTDLRYKSFGELVSRRLAQEMELRIYTSLVVDEDTLTTTMRRLGLTLQAVRTPGGARILNEALGIQGLITGAVYGPFVTSSMPAAHDKVSMALVRTEVRLIDTAKERIAREIVSSNTLSGSESSGGLSAERAQHKAVDIAIDEIISAIAVEIGAMDWCTRVTAVEGTTVFLSAGFQTGLREGDVLEVFPASGGTPRGRIQIFRLFGTDASAAKVVDGGGVQSNDVVRAPLYSS